jgi:NodT family efflux transporter outer membrane factor (OMF) lipoprotein
MSRAFPAILASLTLLAGCTVGPDYTKPDPHAPAGWIDAARRAGITMQSDPDPRWWTRFDDPILSALIDRAIAGNLDLRQAVLRIAEARSSQLEASAAGLPSLNATASYNREQLGIKGILDANHVPQAIDNLPPGGPVSSAQADQLLNQATSPINLFQLGFDASWEIDLFGRVRRSVEAAGAQTQAQIESRNDALVSLEAEVAVTYMRLRGAQTLETIGADNIRVEQDVLDLTRSRHGHGLASELDVDNAASELSNTQAALPQYQQQTAQAMNRLNLLIGQPPGTLDGSLGVASPLPAVPSDVAIGVPASLARRRPDIREAEARLHAATAEVGVSIAQLFPDLSLSGTFGLRNTKAAYLKDWGSNFYTFGPSVSLPIFQGGRLTAQVKMSKAEQAEAALAYQQTVLNALTDVENQLVAYSTDQRRADDFGRTLDSSAHALSLARDAYAHGLTSFLQVLNAERTLAEARTQAAQAQVTVATDLVSLYKALGGGWQDTKVPATN